MTNQQRQAIRELVEIAIRTEMPDSDRILFMEAIAELLPESEAAAARHVAWMVRKCDEQQANFLTLLNPVGGDGETTFTPK